MEALPGHVGDMDVNDVNDAASAVIARGGIDASRVAVFGGSHGGLLIAHLAGQFQGFERKI